MKHTSTKPSRRNSCRGYASSTILGLFLLMSSIAFGQTKDISGTIRSLSDGTTIPGVNVTIKGTTRGVMTDADGKYAIKAAPGDTLRFTFISFKAEERVVGSDNIINISMATDQTVLDEVIVVGYGSRRKADISGSVAVIDVKAMNQISTNDISQQLQGRTAGVQVNTDGQPGSVPSVRIRGVTTFGDAQPLYVIDGIPIQGIPRDFNPNDVESMQVLKDAAAAAIYGARGANGVIIITTKQGKQNQPLKVNYNMYYGIDQVWQRMPVAGTAEYRALNAEVRQNAPTGPIPLAPGNDPESAAFITGVDTDWQEEILKNGMRQNHNLELYGGGQSSTYLIGLDYWDNKGTLVGNGPDYKRYSARLNTAAEKGRVKVGVNLYYTYSKENSLTFRDDILLGGVPPLINAALLAIPTQQVLDPNNLGGFGGTEAEIHDAISLNVVGVNSLFENYIEVDKIFATGFFEFNLINNGQHKLDYRLNLGWEKTHTRDFAWQPAFDLGYFYNSDVARLNDNSRILNSGTVENLLKYNSSFGKHKLDVTAGQTFQSRTFLLREAGAQGFSTPYYPSLANGAVAEVGQYQQEDYLVSFLGRIEYNYDDRYLVNITTRSDASSKFADANRTGIFPSVSAAWRITNESFFTLNKDIFTDIKLRASYGILGNENIAAYQYLSLVNRNIIYNFNGQRVLGGSQLNLVAENIKWEELTTTNIAADFLLFKGKIDFTVEYFNRTTSDLLVGVPIPASTGSINLAPVVNAGVINNRGWEFLLSYRNSKGNFNYEISANYSYITNEVRSLGGNGEPIFGVGAKTEEGQPISQHFGWVFDGIFQTQDEVDAHAFQNVNTSPGDIRFKDLNGDGTIDENDRTYLGNSVPKHLFGINLSAGYKNFDFNMFLSGAGGYLINSNMYRSLMHTTGYSNWHTDMYDRWTPENPSNEISRLVADDPNQNGRDSDRPGWLQNGTHLRLANIQVGYSFSESLIKGIFQKARVYVAVQNLYTFQSYKGYNPDFTSGVFNQGFDFGSYPRPRTYMIGAQISF